MLQRAVSNVSDKPKSLKPKVGQNETYASLSIFKILDVQIELLKHQQLPLYLCCIKMDGMVMT